MNYIVKYAIKHPCNKETNISDEAAFFQPSDAGKWAKEQANSRNKYDKETPFEYAVLDKANNKIISRYFNHRELIN